MMDNKVKKKHVYGIINEAEVMSHDVEIKYGDNTYTTKKALFKRESFFDDYSMRTIFNEKFNEKLNKNTELLGTFTIQFEGQKFKCTVMPSGKTERITINSEHTTKSNDAFEKYNKQLRELHLREDLMHVKVKTPDVKEIMKSDYFANTYDNLVGNQKVVFIKLTLFKFDIYDLEEGIKDNEVTLSKLVDKVMKTVDGK